MPKLCSWRRQPDDNPLYRATQVRFSHRAQSDVAGIAEPIARDNPARALTTVPEPRGSARLCRLQPPVFIATMGGLSAAAHP
jgi:hypothetical protein